MSQPKYTCLNNPLEFWDVLKIPQAVLATPSHPGPSSTPKSPPILNLPTELLLAIFEAIAHSPNSDPLDQLSLALTCKPLLHVASAIISPSPIPNSPRKGIPIPSIKSHAPFVDPPARPSPVSSPSSPPVSPPPGGKPIGLLPLPTVTSIPGTTWSTARAAATCAPGRSASGSGNSTARDTSARC
ncbi:hypothetical protein PG996_000094 [Apiospora saccharicola]|uniref:F-box domain-containing protein n=1 Tax=Apiospora saccharicola TaxID=335842 RepID=A0ABR1WCS2_9PEZI